MIVGNGLLLPRCGRVDHAGTAEADEVSQRGTKAVYVRQRFTALVDLHTRIWFPPEVIT